MQNKSLTIPYWIQFQDNELTLGFNTSQEVEEFLSQQSNQKDWHKQWKIERIYQADDTIQWIASTDQRVVLNFPKK